MGGQSYGGDDLRGSYAKSRLKVWRGQSYGGVDHRVINAKI